MLDPGDRALEFLLLAPHRPGPGGRQAADDRLAARIREVHRDSDCTYGAPRITAELRDEGGQVVNHKRVARIMRTIGLQPSKGSRRTWSQPRTLHRPDLRR
ncbi:IS3 family transposase [Streptomyces sp. NBC_01320]|uniref:IS3 family transposase n=1 Tax=Streptomyces sp. NBC_01320 TaxID=2903824 RepID=UPI003FA3568F